MTSFAKIKEQNQAVLEKKSYLASLKNKSLLDLIDKQNIYLTNDFKLTHINVIESEEKFKYKSFNSFSNLLKDLDTNRTIYIHKNSFSLHLFTQVDTHEVKLYDSLENIDSSAYLYLDLTDLKQSNILKSNTLKDVDVILNITSFEFEYTVQEFKELLETLSESIDFTIIHDLQPSLSLNQEMFIRYDLGYPSQYINKELASFLNRLIKREKLNREKEQLATKRKLLLENANLFKVPHEMQNISIFSIPLYDEFRIEVMHRNLLHHGILLYRNNDYLYFDIRQLPNQRIKELTIQCFYQLA